MCAPEDLGETPLNVLDVRGANVPRRRSKDGVTSDLFRRKRSDEALHFFNIWRMHSFTSLTSRRIARPNEQRCAAAPPSNAAAGADTTGICALKPPAHGRFLTCAVCT